MTIIGAKVSVSIRRISVKKTNLKRYPIEMCQERKFSVISNTKRIIQNEQKIRFLILVT